MIHPVILAGGKGERFWPYSNSRHPKQLLPLVTKHPMLEDILGLTARLGSKAPVHIIAGANLETPIRTLLRGRRGVKLVGEPVGRNTAAALALACRLIMERDPRGVMTVHTADQAIAPPAEFVRAFRAAADLAAHSDTLVTFGILPLRPDPGYGYIEAGEPCPDQSDLKVHQVRRFHEKPSVAEASRYLAAGNFFWNSGMFIWRVDYFWSLLEKFLPELAGAFAGLRPPFQGPKFSSALRRIYRKIESQSIDTGIMEKAPSITMVVPEFSWDDIGSWSALERRHPADAAGNVAVGSFTHLEARGCTVFSDTGLVAAYGVEDLLIVQYGGVTLVCRKDKVSDLKKLVGEVKKVRGLGKFL